MKVGVKILQSNSLCVNLLMSGIGTTIPSLGGANRGTEHILRTDIHRQAERRKQTAPLYQWNTLSTIETQLKAPLQELLARLDELAESKEETELNLWFHYYALDAIGTIAVGVHPMWLLI